MHIGLILQKAIDELRSLGSTNCTQKLANLHERYLQWVVARKDFKNPFPAVKTRKIGEFEMF